MTTVTTVTDDLIQRMAAAVVQAVEPEQVILFGSQARGEAGSHSDVDLLIIQSEPFGPGHSRIMEMTKVWRALAKFGVPTDIVLYSRDEVDIWRGSRNHVTTRALEEGRVLYERPGSGQTAVKSSVEGLASTGRDAG
ncbi:MAG: nucleotidyltransferase domain-containing protein [Leptolyngbya sp. SIO4C5]|nr:nucleotidyltransferase domain-containing protein [Leptolyngbya sp. SIO4C5]